MFHDLPEALTRDIISPVKEGGDIGGIIKEFEQEEMKRRIYKPPSIPPLIPKECFDEMKKFTEDEFKSKVIIDGKLELTTSDAINEKYHENAFDPIDGVVIEAADNLAAFLEAYLAIQNGIVTPEFDRAVCKFKEKYLEKEKDKEIKAIAGLHFGEIYIDF